MKTTTLFTLTAMTTALLAGGALAQTNGTFLLTSSNTVSPNSPTTRIGIWAAWDDPTKQYMFGGGNYDLTAGDGEFSNPIDIMLGPNSSTGVINGNVITGGVNGQIWIIPGCGFFGCPTNSPSLIALYDWTTTDFTPRTVGLFTSNTSLFTMINGWSGQRIELFPNEFTPGLGGITVVPAPAAWFVLALPLAAATRRRRS